ncbi:mitogen-activated protein kinase kinase kinase 5-like isoform X2 [Magnolia sinica]|uniref:mitogen-activated protein kinase kinase kinase 5-like isoform X2 n=1 Tax=Magnolia sinica TaxID=86752 RepID=UPI0026598726|nr:mitogen-activated protein kinase kinase kinase 5-like isoform X2 [Magnolia sinica]
MYFFKSSANSPSSSSSSPKSSPSSPSKQKIFFWNRKESHPRLTRQRKLRHLSDIEVVGLGVNSQSRPSVSANSTPVSRSPSGRECLSARAAPLPLPLPELSGMLRRAEPGFSSSTKTGRCPLPSPKDGDGADLAIGDGVGDRALSTSAIGRFTYQAIRKGVEHVAASSAGSTLGHVKKVMHDLNAVENFQNDFRLNEPFKSAPTSGLSSPVRSPRRLSTGDFFPSSYMASRGFQAWSDPECQPLDMIFSPHASPEKFMASPDLSPLHSPRMKSPGRKSNNPSGAASPLHPKMSSESSAAWHDSNGIVTVHPLPLPPGATVPSSPVFVHQATAKSEVPPMINQWQKGKLIGSGTFGNVYVATNRETGALCAMKEVNLIPDDPKSAESMKQLEQEIKVLSQLKHPNIVQYFGSEIVEDRFYIYLEYVHPGSMSKYVRENIGAMTESVVRNFTRHILSGLAYLHGKNTIHRDIKGANLLVDASGVVKLADFGMAKHLSGQAAALSMKGSPYWMAPEVMQAMMQKEAGYDHAVDIWSLGCTIIEMLTGKPPWSEFEGAAAMFKVLKNESPPIPDTLSPEGKNFIQFCLRRNPAERPSASKLLEHPFIRNSCHQELPGMKLMDTTTPAPSPRERTNFMPIPPGMLASKQFPNGETGQSYHETSESAAASRHSPRSTLEAIPSLSPPHSNHGTRGSSSSSVNLLNGLHLGASSGRSYVLPQFHGAAVTHLS